MRLWVEKYRVLLGFAVVLAACLQAVPALAGPYRDFAERLNASPPEGAMYRPDLEEELGALANAYRAEEGKKPVKQDTMFRELARAHAADMMINNFMGHKASTGHDFSSRVTAYVGDVTRFPSIGENAARDTQKTPVDTRKARALFAQWIKSRTHRKNLVNRSYQFVSTGVIQRGNSIWAVQVFFATPREKGLFQ
jgi:uncharacterized protein YkwD